MSVLEPIGDDLWTIEGSVVTFFGFRFSTRMAVARLADGALWLWSPVALTDEIRDAVAGLGEPRFAVEPNSLHHLALGDWTKAFPSLELWAPPALAKKRRDLRFIGELGDEAPLAWRGAIEQTRVQGSVALTEVLFFHQASRTCLVGDLVQRFDPTWDTTWRGWVMKKDGLVGPNGSTPREWRATFLRRDRARAAVRRAIAWEPEHLVIAHGACEMKDATGTLRRAFRWLGV
ncbi:MAG TPA: DUF4336 domain-containing protein [Polyangiaceae bacterium]